MAARKSKVAMSKKVTTPSSKSKPMEPTTSAGKAEAAREVKKEAEAAAPIAPIAEGAVKHISFNKIDLDDTTFMFRAALRTGPLQEHISKHGQQVPIVVRRIEGTQRYQLISGFRRVTAIKALGWPTVAAIIRNDLDDDAQAFVASVTENSSRKTYSDIDRALVIRAYRKRGQGQLEIGKMLGLTSDRQVRKVESLLDLPQSVQTAIDDQDVPFSASHAVILKQRSATVEDLKWSDWPGRVVKEKMTVSQLKRALNAAYDQQKSSGFVSLFRADLTDRSKGVFRLQPTKIEVGRLNQDERAKLTQELELILAALKG